MKSISVIIPCYNSSAYLAESIDSALSQTHPASEVIVVDDGSTDSSPEIMAHYGDRIRVVRQANAGLPAARNAGINQSTGEWLAFLDSDDWWDPDFLLKTARAMESTDAALVYTGWQNIGAPPPYHEPFVPEDYEQSQPSKAARLIRSTGWPVHAALIQRSALLAAGCFDPTLKSCEDFDLWLRLAITRPIARVPEVLAFYRFHPGQMSRNQARIALTHYRVQKSFLRAHPDILGHSDPKSLRSLTSGELMKRGFRAYWRGDLIAARSIFRQVMRDGYGTLSDWKYMLPAWLPEPWHRWLIKQLRNDVRA